MQIKPEELPALGYELLDRLGHQDLVPFIRTWLGKRSRFTWFYYLANLAAAALCAWLFFHDLRSPQWSFGDRFTHFAYGLALCFGLLPIHEVLHALAYRLQGARQTSFAANLKRFYFMAIADRFVANRKEFFIVALTPFVVITAGLIVLLFFAGGSWQLTIAAMLLAHTGMCSGDFGLLSYFACHPDLDIVTWDDHANNSSYFYGKKSG